MTSHPWPTDISHVWTLSRDRTLRFWKAQIGCVYSKTLSLKVPGRATPPVTPTPNENKPRVLLEAGQQTLLRAFTPSSDEEHTYVLAFNPTPASAASGGVFQLIDTFADQLYEARTIECSTLSAHCRLQDFIVAHNILYVLWDRQGQSVVEKTALDPEEQPEDATAVTWIAASYAPELELSPVYLDELLLSPGSLTEQFCEAIMRPGIFSPLTLRTAIDQYTDACLSLPGPPPPQLRAAYKTIAENIVAVVGCTVNLVRDPHTGALLYSKYWNALKRDWEGFIARCRDVERSARWPLVIGIDESKGSLIVVERERVGSLVGEDLALKVHRSLTSGNRMDPPNPVLDISWMLRTRLGPHGMLNMENGLVDILHQEIAFSFADILQDQARRSNFRDELDEGIENWILGRLHGVPNIEEAIRAALDVVGGFDMEVKREEEEVELLIPPPPSEWRKSMISTYAINTVDARYELCLSIFTLLFFLSDDLALWDPSLLAEVFVVFRGIAMLRFVSRLPANGSSGPKPVCDAITADDVVASLSNMHVSSDRGSFTPAYSLFHQLLPASGDARTLSGAAHRFLDNSGLLQSSSPSHATKFEVAFCERLRLLGYNDVARELLAWLPRTSGVIYVLARLWLTIGRADDASSLMEKLAGSFGMSEIL
jgi:nuclear pore complex protein Nup160